MLTLLTTTGARREAWAICEKQMARQDYAGPVRWVIVDDGPEAQPVTFQRHDWTLEVIRREPFWQPGQNTQAANLLAGLAVIGPDERVAVIEDDDHYAPGYLSAVASWLNASDLVGESYARYFNVREGVGRQLSNDTHASLCSTAMKGPALEAFRKSVLRRQLFIDMDLWGSFHGSKHLARTGMVVGIKGLPGRDGIGMGHHKLFGTLDRNMLRLWIGEDAALYETCAAS